MTGSREGDRQVSGPDDASRRGSLSAPGALADAPVAGAETESSEAAQLPGEPLVQLAARYGLQPSAARPPLIEYLRQVWQILTPLLNVAVYYLIFGLILNTKRGVPDFIAFLVIGVFIFNFTQRS